METGWDPGQMRLGESLTSLGNGYMGLRGNFEEDYSGIATGARTWVAFGFRTKPGWDGGKNGYPKYFGKVINAVNLIGVHVLLDGVPLDLNTLTVWEFHREVDMRNGILTRSVMAETPKGSLRIDCERFVSMARKELLALRYRRLRLPLTANWK